jgi:hypothetical protein
VCVRRVGDCHYFLSDGTARKPFVCQSLRRGRLRKADVQPKAMEKPKRTQKPRGTRHTDTAPKLVIRRLPPTLPREIFHNLIQPWEQDFVFWDFVPGKPARAPHATSRTLSSPSTSFLTAKPAQFARAYVAFRTMEGLKGFLAGFGTTRTFIDKQGHALEAMVEFAPSQMIPTNVERNPIEGTLASDPDFIAFCHQLHSPEEKLGEPIVQPKKTSETAIITHLRQRAQRQKPRPANNARLNGTEHKPREPAKPKEAKPGQKQAKKIPLFHGPPPNDNTPLVLQPGAEITLGNTPLPAVGVSKRGKPKKNHAFHQIVEPATVQLATSKTTTLQSLQPIQRPSATIPSAKLPPKPQ